MRTLYFTVDKELEEIDNGLFDATGNKSINLYEIIDNKPKMVYTIETTLENSTIAEISEWLEDNGDEELKRDIQEL